MFFCCLGFVLVAAMQSALWLQCLCACSFLCFCIFWIVIGLFGLCLCCCLHVKWFVVYCYLVIDVVVYCCLLFVI